MAPYIAALSIADQTGIVEREKVLPTQRLDGSQSLVRKIVLVTIVLSREVSLGVSPAIESSNKRQMIAAITKRDFHSCEVRFLHKHTR